MGPLRIVAQLDTPTTERDLTPPHLDALLLAVLARVNGIRQITRSTPESELRQLVAPGLLMIDAAGASCHACTAAIPSDDGRTVTWLAYGTRGEMRRRLKLLHELTLGDDVHDVTWTIEHADHDLTDCFLRDGRTQRHLPLSWTPGALLTDEGAHESPYWHPARQHEMAALGSQATLGADVEQHLVDLDVYYIHHIQSRVPHYGLAQRRLQRLTRPKPSAALPGFWDGPRSDGHVKKDVADLVGAMFRDGDDDLAIGQELGCSRKTVQRLRRALGLLRQDAPGPRVDRDRMRELHHEGKTTAEIASDLGCTHRTAQQLLHELHLPANRPTR